MRAATAAERVHAYSEVAALLDRALELWDRVPDAEARAGVDRVTVLARAADAASALGDPGRQLALLEAALAALGPQPDPRRAAPILESTPARSATSTAPRPASPRSSARSSWSTSGDAAIRGRATCSPAWRAPA